MRRFIGWIALAHASCGAPSHPAPAPAVPNTETAAAPTVPPPAPAPEPVASAPAAVPPVEDGEPVADAYPLLDLRGELCARVAAYTKSLALEVAGKDVYLPSECVISTAENVDPVLPLAQAWLLLVDEDTLAFANSELRGFLRVVYLKKGAEPLRSEPVKFRHSSVQDDDYGGIPSADYPPRRFDYDGDGKDELLLVLDVNGPPTRSGYKSILRVYTAGKKGVELYAPTRAWKLTTYRDFDQDDRPDLVVEKTPGAYKDGKYVDGVYVLAHSLPNGKFSTTDKVARDWAKE